MTTSDIRRPLWTTAAVIGALLSSAAVANAGGFAIREQSTQFLGTAFAGDAAGNGLSSMFWNPATLGQITGLQSESNVAAILPYSTIHALPGSTLLGAGHPADSGNIGINAAVPSSYYGYEFNKQIVVGLSINAPFGLGTQPSTGFWAGQTQTRNNDIRTYTFTPTVAYRVTPNLMVGAGVQIEHMWGLLESASGAGPAAPNVSIEGKDTALGFTLGALWMPTPATSVGLGFRSSVSHTLDGTMSSVGVIPGGFSNNIEAGLSTPETVTASFRHRFNPQFTLLGTVEWARWSRLDKLDIVCTAAGVPLCAAPGALATSLPLNWHDGWFFALGGEYAWSPALTLRAGAAYEISPIQNPSERTPRAPDADRVWATIGAAYAYSEKLSFDFAYAHLFVQDAQIDRTQTGVRLFGDVSSHIDIISVGMKYKWYTPPKAIVTKG